MCSACRFSFSLYFALLPRGIISLPDDGLRKPSAKPRTAAPHDRDARVPGRQGDARCAGWFFRLHRGFFESLARLDAYLASNAPLARSVEQLFQGPIADSLTHVGQIAFLRRLAGAPVRAENYIRATT